ncbi:hypothetical protein [Nitrosospira sp. NRS527]|uniref:hypothetical protein n=1 Tax=Nitrosospira sp. NRS527 TaxID=155925 RepID=UPI001AFACF7C|nr:hypothetical protein [Nitrosospira sp. NRS527]BCT66950.1 hypothetical protein NNRS527_00525 [Nitrosospira sp. NRS527]
MSSEQCPQRFQSLIYRGSQGILLSPATLRESFSASAADAELEPRKSFSRHPEKAAAGGKIQASLLA